MGILSEQGSCPTLLSNNPFEIARQAHPGLTGLFYAHTLSCVIVFFRRDLLLGEIAFPTLPDPGSRRQPRH
jgi:hypothetical protein